MHPISQTIRSKVQRLHRVRNTPSIIRSSRRHQARAMPRSRGRHICMCRSRVHRIRGLMPASVPSRVVVLTVPSAVTTARDAIPVTVSKAVRVTIRVVMVLAQGPAVRTRRAEPKAPRRNSVPVRRMPRLRDRVRATIRSAASRACTCPLRVTSRVRTPWRARLSKVVVEAVVVAAAMVSPMAAVLVRGSGASIVLAKVPAQTAVEAAIISAAASRTVAAMLVRPVAAAVVVAVPQVHSVVRAASPRKHARTVSRSVMNIRR